MHHLLLRSLFHAHHPHDSPLVCQIGRLPRKAGQHPKQQIASVPSLQQMCAILTSKPVWTATASLPGVRVQGLWKSPVTSLGPARLSLKSWNSVFLDVAEAYL